MPALGRARVCRSPYRGRVAGPLRNHEGTPQDLLNPPLYSRFPHPLCRPQVHRARLRVTREGGAVDEVDGVVKVQHTHVEASLLIDIHASQVAMIKKRL